MARFMTNRYAGSCNTCGQAVPANGGFGRYEGSGRGSFQTYHNSQHCLPAAMVAEASKPSRRELTEAGEVFMPYEADNLPLLRSMPGARFDRERKCWTVSLKVQDRARVLDLSSQLKLVIAPALLKVERSLAVDAILERARLAGAYPFQVQGIEFLSLSEGSRMLCDDQGIGKTIQALMAIPKGSRVLSVVPACVKGNWADECRKWRPDLTPFILSGKKNFRFPEEGEMVIINPESLPTWMSSDCEKSKYFKPAWTEVNIAGAKGVLLVVDECHMYANHKTSRSKKISALVTYCGRSWGLTGTPLLSRPFDLWGVLSSFGLQWEVFGSWDRFLNLFGAHRNAYGGTEWSGDPSPEVAERLRRIMLRRVKSEVLPDLPDKTFQTLRVDLPASMKRAMDKAWKSQSVNRVLERIRSGVHSQPSSVEDWYELLVMAEGHPVAEDYLRQHRCPFTYEEAHGQIGESLREAILSKSVELCLPPFEEISKIRAELAEARIKPMMQILESYEDSGTPLVVFSAHRAPIDALDFRPGWATITGSTPPAKRSEIVASFQAGELKGIGLTIKAGGVGITLTRASTMLFVDLDWTPSLNTQAEDRIHRIGQEAKGCHYLRMVSNHPLDTRVQQLIEFKMGISRKAIDGKVNASSPTTPAPIEIRKDSLSDFQGRVAETRKAQEARDAAISFASASADEGMRDRYNESTRTRIPEWTARYSKKSGRPVRKRIGKRRKGLLQQAFAYLLGQCDGAQEDDGIGFNKPDAALARRLHTVGLDEDGVDQMLDVMLVKYHPSQLSAQFPDLY